MSDPKPVNGAQLLAEIQPQLREGAARICMRPDLIDEWTDANETLTEAQQADASNKRLGSGASAATRKLAKRVRELEEEIAKTEVRFVFRAIPKARYSVIVEEHPPREKNYFDLSVGYNREAVDNELVRVCLIDPEFDEESWQNFLDVCNPSEWDELVRVVRDVNGVQTTAPKSVAASLILDKRADSSRRPASGK